MLAALFFTFFGARALLHFSPSPSFEIYYPVHSFSRSCFPIASTSQNIWQLSPATMRFQSLAVSLLLALPALSKPTGHSAPIDITAITAEDIALSGGQIPTTYSSSRRRLSGPTLANLQLLNHLQNLKYALLSGAIANLTSSPAYFADPNYSGPWPINTTVNDASPSVFSALSRLAAQDKVQLATTQTLLKTHGADIVKPCSYVFPATSLTTFLSLSRLITNIVVDFLFDFDHTRNHENGFLSTYLASIAAVQARHDSTIRLLTNSYPSPTPFDTSLPAAYAYNLANLYILPGSCARPLPFPAIPRLDNHHPASGKPDPSRPPPKEVTLSYAPNQRIEAASELYLGWVSQLGKVVYTPFTKNGTTGGASPPPMAKGWNAKGAVYVVLTNQGTEANVDALVRKTLAGPTEIILS